MWPLIRDFFTTKSAGVRGLRVALGIVGAVAASGRLPLPEGWEWAGVALVALSAAITGQDDPQEKPE